MPPLVAKSSVDGQSNVNDSPSAMGYAGSRFMEADADQGQCFEPSAPLVLEI